MAAPGIFSWGATAGHVASALRASLYGGLGAESPVGSRGRAPGGDQGPAPRVYSYDKILPNFIAIRYGTMERDDFLMSSDMGSIPDPNSIVNVVTSVGLYQTKL